MKFYVYCLAEKIDAPPSVRGISGARVDVMTVEDWPLFVSEFEGDAAPPVTRENVLAHDAVVRSMLSETTPLPFRFGTVQTQSQLVSYMRTHRAALAAKLAQIRGCVEMNVKIISPADTTGLNTTSEPDEQGPGARFLKEKQRELLGSEQRAKEAREVATWLEAQVEPFARQEQVSLCPTEKLIVAAAHLIAREQVTKYRDHLASARNLRPELHFLVSGPWPPYTFSNIELEFKTRFGVS